MNFMEKEMFDLLRHGRESYGFTHVRAEFEAEGTRVDELLRLTELGYKAGLDLAIKIGGCESLTGLYNARQLGASAIVAPMIESTYALKKYAQTCVKVFPQTDQYDTKFYFNIETAQAYAIHQELIAASQELGLNGIVFGRVDFSASLGLAREKIETAKITQHVLDVARACQASHQELILGGAISTDSIPALREISKVYLSHFETRKIVFDTSQLTHPTLIKALLAAARFELLWLKNKQTYYQIIGNEDRERIILLEKRASDSLPLANN